MSDKRRAAPMAPHRELDAADIDAVFESVAEVACEQFNTEGHCVPALATVAFGAPGEITSIHLMPPESTRALLNSKEGKEALMRVIRRMLGPAEGAPTSPIGCFVHVCEAWVLRMTDGREPGQGSLEHHPDRDEAILVTVHTRHRSYGGQCLIVERDGVRRAESGALFHKTPGTRMRGRLTLNPDEPWH